MILLIKITEIDFLNSKDSFLRSLDLNISNSLIKRIIVFTDSNNLNLNRSKVAVIPTYGIDSDLMNIASSIYPNDNLIWSNKFDLSNNKVKVNPKVVKVHKKDRRTIGEKIIPIREVKVKVNPKIDVIIVSVNYNDFLLVSLTNNIKYFKNITVVTSSDDLMCQNICDKFKVKCVITERMYENGSSFNKGKAINEGIKSINNPDWILLMDADIVLCDKLELSDINEDILYTTDRYICNDYNTYKEWMENNIKLENIGKYESEKGLGFFQLFNIKNKNIDIKKPFPEASDNAAWSDLQFRDKFSKRKKVEISTIHLGPDKINWNGRESVKFITDDEFYNLSIATEYKSTFTICSFYFNFRNDIRQKNNFIKFLEQFKDHYDNMIVGIVDYGDIDFEIPCESIIIKGDSENKLWSKEILINKIIDKVDTDYLLWIDGDLIYNNLDWLNNIDKVVNGNDFVQLFEDIKYLGESGELLESHKSLISSGGKNIDNLSGYKPGGSWLGKVSILKDKKLFEKMYVGGGDTIFMCGLLGVKKGVTLIKVKESNEDIYNESIEWIDNFGKYKVGYLSETVNHLYHGDLKDRNYNSRYKELSKPKVDINSYLPEFGYELISCLPYAYDLFLKDSLKSTTSGLDTSCLYFFSPDHKEVSEKRGWNNMTKLWNIKFPNIGIHSPSLDWSKFTPPPLKEFYNDKKIVFKKETVVICNRYNLEWNEPPINYIDIETLKILFNMLKDEYQIVYINLKGDKRYYDDAPPLELGDFDMINDYYKDDVMIIQDMVNEYTYNETQLRIFAGCSKFITSNGGQAILASYFGGENIIFTKKCREINPEVNSFYRWYHKFGNSIIKVVNSEIDLIDIIESKWVRKDPLINILIRTSNRPNYFKYCMDSIYNQTYKNWNIIVGVDDKSSEKYIQPHKCIMVSYNFDDYKIPPTPSGDTYGVKFKYNIYFNELHKYIQDGYIMYIDDDDKLHNINSLSNISSKLLNNDLIFWRVNFPNRLVPNDENFSKKIPIMRDVSGIGFIFKNNIKEDWEPYKRGDYRIAKKLFDKSVNVEWVNEVITGLQRIEEDGFGRRDDKK